MVHILSAEKSKPDSLVTSISWAESAAETALKHLQKENWCFHCWNPVDIKDVFEFLQLEGAK